MSGNSKPSPSGIPLPIKHRSSGHVGSPRDEEQTKIRRELTEYGINISNVQLQNDRLQAIFQSLTTVDLPSLTQRLDAIESQVKLLYEMTTTKMEAIISEAISNLKQPICDCQSLDEPALTSRNEPFLRRSESFESISSRSYNSFTFSKPPSTLFSTLNAGDGDDFLQKTMDYDDDGSPCVSIVDDDWDSGDTRSVVTALSTVSQMDYLDDNAVDYRQRALNTTNLMPENGDASRCFMGKINSKMGDFSEKSFLEGQHKLGRHHERSASGDDATIVVSSGGDSRKELKVESSPYKVKVPSSSSDTFRRLLDALQILRNGTKIERNMETH